MLITKETLNEQASSAQKDQRQRDLAHHHAVPKAPSTEARGFLRAFLQHVVQVRTGCLDAWHQSDQYARQQSGHRRETKNMTVYSEMSAEGIDCVDQANGPKRDHRSTDAAGKCQ